MTRQARTPTEAWTQLSLTGEDDHTQYVRDEVLAIDPSHHTNGQRVADLARLGYLPEPVLDPTFGYGAMWTHYRPAELHVGDANIDKIPLLGNGIVWAEVLDFRAMGFPNGRFGSVLYDPPYGYRGRADLTDTGEHDDLYGTDEYRTKAEITALILDGAAECARVAREVLIVKCQDQVVAGSTSFQTRVVDDHLEALGWFKKDRLHLLSYRPQPAGRSQRNARNNFSTFSVYVRAGALDTRSQE